MSTITEIFQVDGYLESWDLLLKSNESLSPAEFAAYNRKVHVMLTAAKKQHPDIDYKGLFQEHFENLQAMVPESAPSVAVAQPAAPSSEIAELLAQMQQTQELLAAQAIQFKAQQADLAGSFKTLATNSNMTEQERKHQEALGSHQNIHKAALKSAVPTVELIKEWFKAMGTPDQEHLGKQFNTPVKYLKLHVWCMIDFVSSSTTLLNAEKLQNLFLLRGLHMRLDKEDLDESGIQGISLQLITFMVIQDLLPSNFADHKQWIFALPFPPMLKGHSAFNVFNEYLFQWIQEAQLRTDATTVTGGALRKKMVFPTATATGGSNADLIEGGRRYQRFVEKYRNYQPRAAHFRGPPPQLAELRNKIKGHDELFSHLKDWSMNVQQQLDDNEAKWNELYGKPCGKN